MFQLQTLRNNFPVIFYLTKKIGLQEKRKKVQDIS